MFKIVRHNVKTTSYKPLIRNMRESAVEFLICGAFGGICCVLLGHPLDTVKVRLQTMPKPNPGEAPLYTGTFDCIKKSIAKEGFLGLYKGVTAPLLATPPIFAVGFAGYGLGKSLFRSAPDKPLTLLQNFLAGGFSGICSTIFMTPGERIKCLLQAQEASGKKLYNGTLDCAVKLYKQGGIRTIYKGTVATLLRDVPAAAMYYVTYEKFKDYVTDDGTKEMGFTMAIIGGGCAGITNWIVAMPADVIKSRLQTSETSASVGVIFREVIKENGILGLYQGITPVLLRAFPANAVCFLGFEVCKRVLSYIY